MVNRKGAIVGYIITEKGWKLNEEPQSPLPDNPIPLDDRKWLSDPRDWDQYQDPVIYDLEIKLREWIEEMSKNPQWRNKTINRRYTYKDLWEQVTGTKYDQKTNAKYTVKFSRLLGWYSSRIQKGGSLRGKKCNHKIYTISPKRLNCAPYCLKLRLRWLRENGIIPDNYNMKRPTDLKPGHARNPRTEKNMEKKREEGRRRYNEWKARHDQEKAEE